MNPVEESDKEAEARARAIAAHDQLSMLDVVAVVVGLRPGENADCTVTQEGVRALDFSTAELASLTEGERNAIGDHARDVSLDFPCTLEALLNWAERQRKYGGFGLVAAFEQIVRGKLGKRPAHRPRKLDAFVAAARAAASEICEANPQARTWTAWEMVTHRSFIEKVFPGKSPIGRDELDERKYTKHYSAGPRALETAVLAVMRRTPTANK